MYLFREHQLVALENAILDGLVLDARIPAKSVRICGLCNCPARLTVDVKLVTLAGEPSKGMRVFWYIQDPLVSIRQLQEAIQMVNQEIVAEYLRFRREAPTSGDDSHAKAPVRDFSVKPDGPGDAENTVKAQACCSAG